MATKRKYAVRNEHVKVQAHFHEHGSVLRGDAEGFCDRFEVEISFDTDESEANARELVRLARQMCFTEKALSGVPVTVAARVNGQALA